MATKAVSVCMAATQTRPGLNRLDKVPTTTDWHAVNKATMMKFPGALCRKLGRAASAMKTAVETKDEIIPTPLKFLSKK